MTTSHLDLCFHPSKRQAQTQRQAKPGKGWGLTTIAFLCLLAAALLVSESALIRFKAWLGPILLRQAWAESLDTAAPVKPWYWADMHPKAQLLIPALDVDLIALNDSSGEALTWGPGLWRAVGDAPANGPGDRPTDEGANGLTIMTGHRDTHFRFLSDIELGMPVHRVDDQGLRHDYVTQKTQIVDVRTDQITKPDDGTWLLLVTCHPFDGVDPNTPYRYLVWARQLPNQLAVNHGQTNEISSE